MEISIQYNKIHIRNVELGDSFSNMKGDLVISKNGFVEVRATTIFYTSVDCLPLPILNLLATELENRGMENKLLQKVKRILLRNRL